MAMKDLIIFGTGNIADVLFYYFTNESEFNTVAFTVDSKYITDATKNGLPIIPFDEIEQHYPTETHCMFIALGYQNLNDLRQHKLKQAKEKGFEIISFIHPRSNIPNDLVYGENCFIMNNASIHPRVKLGNNVFVWSGAIIGHHSIIEDHCWLTSGSNVAGDVVIGSNSFLAINATIAHRVKIGQRCFIGSNALVIKNIADKTVMIEKPTQPYRLDSDNFLKLTGFSDT